MEEQHKIPAFSPVLRESRTVINYADDDGTDTLTERSQQAAGSLYDLPNYESSISQVNANIESGPKAAGAR